MSKDKKASAKPAAKKDAKKVVVQAKPKAAKPAAKAEPKLVTRAQVIQETKTAGKKVVEVQVKKPTASKSNAKRDLNSELLEGMQALKAERGGKVKLKTITPAAAPAKKPSAKPAVKVEAKPAPVVAKAARTRSSLDNKARDIAGE